jgi:DNA-binding Xre family transcriptional regulator
MKATKAGVDLEALARRRINLLIEERGHGTKSELARYLECDRGMVTYLLNGKRQLRLHWLKKIADFLNVKASDLIDTSK